MHRHLLAHHRVAGAAVAKEHRRAGGRGECEEMEAKMTTSWNGDKMEGEET